MESNLRSLVRERWRMSQGERLIQPTVRRWDKRITYYYNSQLLNDFFQFVKLHPRTTVRSFLPPPLPTGPSSSCLAVDASLQPRNENNKNHLPSFPLSLIPSPPENHILSLSFRVDQFLLIFQFFYLNHPLTYLQSIQIMRYKEGDDVTTRKSSKILNNNSDRKL